MIGVTPAVSVQGDFNTVRFHSHIQVDGDAVEVHFSEANLEDVQPPEFESPPIADRIIKSLANLRLVVLGGLGVDDKSLLARHLAWRLQDQLRSEDPLGKDLPVKEWNPPREALDIEDVLRKLESPTILLLRDARPYLLGHDLRRLHAAVCQHEHHAIVITEATAAQWNVRQGEPEAHFWWSPRTEDIYEPDYLVQVLRLRLHDVRDRLPRNLLQRGQGEREAPFFARLTMQDVAIRLRTPHSIRSFVHLLCSMQEIEEDQLNCLLEQFRGDEQGIRAWYRNLDTRQQILVLALAMFDGLFDDQLFAALESVVTSAWRGRDPTFVQFDYHEMINLDSRFQGTGPAREIRRIESRSSDLRPVLLDSAWEYHRRLLLTALPVLTGLLTRSITRIPGRRGWSNRWSSGLTQSADELLGEEYEESLEFSRAPQADTAASQEEARLSGWQPHGLDRELFGSPIRTNQICRAVAATLSDIGRISFNSVEPFLLDIAGSRRKELRAIVAASLAEWHSRKSTLNKDLFRALSEWHDEACRRSPPKDDKDKLARIRGTVALTLSFAAQYDSFNEMSPGMIPLLEKLVADRHPIVREVLREETLPLIVGMHPRQLEQFLWHKVLPYVDLMGGVARGLAAACALQSEVALSILDQWFARSRSDRAASIPNGAPRTRELTLATVILAYGNLNFEQIRDRQLPGKVFERLRSVLADENHQFVRRSVLWAAMLQARRNFTKVSTLVQELSGEIVLDERAELIQDLTELYLEQRARLRRGEDVVVIGSRSYQVWPWSPRPFTEIETILYNWVRDDRQPVAQQLAFECLASFLSTPLDQKERELAVPRQVSGPELASLTSLSPPVAVTAPVPPIRVYLRAPSFFGLLAIWFATRGEPARRAVVRTLFPELVHWSESPGREASLRLLDRWQAFTDPDFQRVAILLGKVFLLFQKRRFYTFGAIFLSLLLLAIIGSMF